MKNKSWIKILLTSIFLICFGVIGNAQTSAPHLNQYLHRDADGQDDVDKFQPVKDQVVVMSDCIAQKEPIEVVVPKPIEDENAKPKDIYWEVDLPAEFPGGANALMKWLSNNIRYPEAAQQNNVQGRVVVKLLIDKDGSVIGVTVVKGVDKDLDAEAMRVVKTMPKWQPARKDGQAVRSYFALPISFRLQEEATD